MVVAGPRGVAAGSRGAADLRLVRRDPFSRYVGFIVRVTRAYIVALLPFLSVAMLGVIRSKACRLSALGCWDG